MAATKIYGSDQIEGSSIEKEQLHANIAGVGLAKAAEADALSIKVSGTTLGFAGVGGVDGLKVATDGITSNEIATGAVIRDGIGANAVGATELDETGSYAMAGLSMLGGNATPHKITGVLAGTDPNDVVTKSQLDGISSGIYWKAPVKYIAANHAAHGGFVLVVGNSIINTTNQKVYTVTAGSGDGDEVTWDAGVMPAEADARFVTSTDAAYVYDADGVAWIQFTGAGQINAGTGLSKSGNTINANVGDGLEVNGTDPNDFIRVKLDGTTLARSSDGMKVAADGVTSTELKDQDSYSMIGLTLTGTITDPATIKYIKASGTGVLSGQVGVPIADTNLSAGNGIALGGTGNAVLSIDLSDTNPSLEIADGGLRAKVDAAGAIERTANGLNIKAGGITEAMLNAAVELGFEVTRGAAIEAPNGTRKEFTYAYQVVIGSELIHLNGLLQQGVEGVGTAPVDDYEIKWNVGSSGKTHVYFAKAPKSTARILMTCRVVGE